MLKSVEITRVISAKLPPGIFLGGDFSYPFSEIFLHTRKLQTT